MKKSTLKKCCMALIVILCLTLVLFAISGFSFETEDILTDNNNFNRAVLPVGTGTASDPYIISTPAHLNDLRVTYLDTAYRDKFFRLDNDIDLTAYLSSGGAGYAQWGSAGWMPISAEKGLDITPFYGNLDGAGYKITGLWMNRPIRYAGLFGMIYGSIKNLGIEFDNSKGGIRSSGSTGNENYIGGLAGSSSATISNCYVKGNFNQKDMATVVVNVGGLVGDGGGLITNCYTEGSMIAEGVAGGLVAKYSGRIDNCYSKIDITTKSSNAGGLVGNIFNSAKINNCYATGNITAASTYSISGFGGLIGYARNKCTINNSYATGTVNVTGAIPTLIGGLMGSLEDSEINNSYATGNINVTATHAESGAGGIGGLAGGIIYKNSNSKIENCYTTGKIEITGNSGQTIGGFLGMRDRISHSIINCFYDTQTTGYPDGSGIGGTGTPSQAGVTGRSTADMKKKATFTTVEPAADWDFITIWNINEGVTYPYLRIFMKLELQRAILLANSKEKNNYTTESWNAMQEILTVARQVNDDINATQQEIDTATLNLNTAINNLVPGLPDELLIDVRKEAAKEALNIALAEYEITHSINIEAVRTEKNKGDANIDDAETIDEVETAKQNALDAMAQAAGKSDAELLAEAKAAAKEELNEALAGYENTHSINIDAIILEKETGDINIDNAATIDEVETAKNNALEAMETAAGKSDAELLAEAKAAAKEELDLELEKYETGYTINYENIKDAKEDGDSEIDKAATIDEVTRAKETAIDNMAGFKPDAEIELEEFIEYVEKELAKDLTKEELEELLNEVEDFKEDHKDSDLDRLEELEAEIKDRISKKEIEEFIEYVEEKLAEDLTREELESLLNEIGDFKEEHKTSDLGRLEELEEEIKERINEKEIEEFIEYVEEKLEEDLSKKELEDLLEEVENFEEEKDINLDDLKGQIEEKIKEKEIEEFIEYVEEKLQEDLTKEELEDLLKEVENFEEENEVNLDGLKERIEEKIKEKEIEEFIEYVEEKLEEDLSKEELEDLLEEVENFEEEKDINLDDLKEQIEEKIKEKELEEFIEYVEEKLEEDLSKEELEDLLEEVENFEEEKDVNLDDLKGQIEEQIKEKELEEQLKEIEEDLEKEDLTDDELQALLDKIIDYIEKKLEQDLTKEELEELLEIIDKFKEKVKDNDNLDLTRLGELEQEIINRIKEKELEEFIEYVEEKLEEDLSKEELEDLLEEVENFEEENDVNLDDLKGQIEEQIKEKELEEQLKEIEEDLEKEDLTDDELQALLDKIIDYIEKKLEQDLTIEELEELLEIIDKFKEKVKDNDNLDLTRLDELEQEIINRIKEKELEEFIEYVEEKLEEDLTKEELEDLLEEVENFEEENDVNLDDLKEQIEEKIKEKELEEQLKEIEEDLEKEDLTDDELQALLDKIIDYIEKKLEQDLTKKELEELLEIIDKFKEKVKDNDNLDLTRLDELEQEIINRIKEKDPDTGQRIDEFIEYVERELEKDLTLEELENLLKEVEDFEKQYTVNLDRLKDRIRERIRIKELEDFIDHIIEELEKDLTKDELLALLDEIQKYINDKMLDNSYFSSVINAINVKINQQDSPGSFFDSIYFKIIIIMFGIIILFLLAILIKFKSKTNKA